MICWLVTLPQKFKEEIEEKETEGGGGGWRSQYPSNFGAGLEINSFHYVYCTHQISDTVCTGNLDVCTLSHSHEIYLLQSKVNRLINLILYTYFQTLMHICLQL